MSAIKCHYCGKFYLGDCCYACKNNGNDKKEPKLNQKDFSDILKTIFGGSNESK